MSFRKGFRKGISPLIAAVLLIAFTMAIASLFAQWAPQLFESAQGDTVNRSAQIQDCARYNIQIQDATNDTATISQVAGPDPIGNMSVTWFYNDDGAEPIQDFAEIDTVSGSVTLDVSGEPNGGDDLQQVDAQSLSCDTVTSTFPPDET